LPDTIRLPGNRIALIVPGDNAGEISLHVCNDEISIREASGRITWRQAYALRHIARLYRTSGGQVAWHRGFGAGERCEEAAAAASAELHSLLYPIRQPTRSRLLAIAQADEWLATWTPGSIEAAADLIADHLRLKREQHA